MPSIKIGVDVGNYDTKSQHTTTSSSYQSSEKKDYFAEETILYKGKYYSPTEERNNQQTDKTENGYAFIMTLFAIAKEVIFQIKSQTPNITDEEIQKTINTISEVKLGVGLPAGYMSSLAKSTKEKYMKEFGESFTFTYYKKDTSFEFNLKVVSCEVLPQDYTSVAFNDKLETVKQFSDYYIIGIGGGTVDIIPVAKGQVQVNACSTMVNGTTVLYDEIIQKIQKETAKTMDAASVEAVLRNRNVTTDEARKKRIKEISSEYAQKLVDELLHKGLKLADKPAVFVGGGALLIKEDLLNSKAFSKIEIVEDVNANAKFFAAFA